MPEYLAPGVYVEEVDTGPKPIEGVSTSTAAMVGVTERGPRDIPVLVTGVGEFQRWFGGRLPHADFGGQSHLPLAVEGFFTNGGKRLFVARVADDAIVTAAATLFRAAPGAAEARLLRTAAAGDNSAVVLGDSLAGATAATQVRVGDGSTAEYRTLTGASAAVAAVTLLQPLAGSHAVGAPLEVLTAAAANSTLAAPAAAGATTLTVAAAFAPAAGSALAVGGGNTEEFVGFTGTTANAAGDVVVALAAALRNDHAAGAAVAEFDAAAAASTTLAAAAPAATAVIEPAAAAGFTAAGTVVRVGAGAAAEVRRTGSLGAVAIAEPAAAEYPAGSTVEEVTAADAVSTTLAAAAAAGATFVTVASRTGVAADDVIRLDGAEFAVVAALPSPGPAPDPGKLVLAAPLRAAYPVGAAVRLQTITPTANPPGVLVLAAAAGAEELVVTGATAAGLLRVRAPGAPARFHVATAAAAALAPQRVTFAAPVLTNAHPAGATLGVREPQLDVSALDPGGWGNRLRVSVEPEGRAVVNTTVRAANGVVDDSHVRLAAMTGVEVGTVLQRFDAAGAPVGTPFKVTAVNAAADFVLTLDAALVPPPQPGERVRSVEFRLTVRLLRRPDPAAPAREVVQDAEVFPALSLDHRHSRYVHDVIGTTWDPTDPAQADRDGHPLRLVDRRSRGESRYVRVRDRLSGVATEPVRTGPEFLTDRTPAGEVPARTELRGGDDPAVTAARLVGADDAEPARRTGIQCLRNEDEISLVAAPGFTAPAVVLALTAHCEAMRYRFAVLDGPPPPEDTIADVRAARQPLDTKYAALYHPWLHVPDPFPANPAAVGDHAVPPSGHVLGVYARTDAERGVHKAPANEVVRGIVGLRRALNKAEQDLLNPFPVNVNVIRDFRAEGRGLRVWGARVVTSDPDWKYVNVRRLFLFVEKSLERGLQWVVFEPNAEPLWARVRRAAAAFLDRVWRDGALEGTTATQAYFVKVDRTTMTQADIDSGRLVVLIGIAPVKPAEFVIIRVGLFTADAPE
ncbi:MAG TPA: phage tail sheath C-terminal domain-containing protein [Urbifossiella sp.]|nr:phage tail sheath C-terminal domain-containing protein [Urbifossiella sp.]